MNEIQQQLAAAGIRLLTPEATHYCLFAREPFFALVERKGDRFGSIGSAGIWTEHGLAFLVWREGEARLVSKGFETAAEPEQVIALKRFSADLAGILGQA